MKEYIERQKAKEAIAAYCAPIKNSLQASALNELLVQLDVLPAADVVEVVRCKDCKYYAAMITDTASGNMETAPWGICTQPWFNSDEYDVQENGYCSYGKRKEE